jgi:hypothetical protein
LLIVSAVAGGVSGEQNCPPEGEWGCGSRLGLLPVASGLPDYGECATAPETGRFNVIVVVRVEAPVRQAKFIAPMDD